jgi:hypothetical protein
MKKNMHPDTIRNLSLLEVGRWFKEITLIPNYHVPYGKSYTDQVMDFDQCIKKLATLRLRNHILKEDTHLEMMNARAEFIKEVYNKLSGESIITVERFAEGYCQSIFHQIQHFLDPNFQVFFNHRVAIDIGPYRKDDEVYFVFLTPQVLYISFLFGGAESINYEDYREYLMLLALGLLNEFGVRKKIFLNCVKYGKWRIETEEFTGAGLYEWFNKKIGEMREIVELDKSDINDDNPRFMHN